MWYIMNTEITSLMMAIELILGFLQGFMYPTRITSNMDVIMKMKNCITSYCPSITTEIERTSLLMKQKTTNFVSPYPTNLVFIESYIDPYLFLKARLLSLYLLLCKNKPVPIGINMANYKTTMESIELIMHHKVSNRSSFRFIIAQITVRM